MQSVALASTAYALAALYARLAGTLLPVLVAWGLAGPAGTEVRGTIHTADAGPVAGLRVVARAGAFADTAVVDAAGRFTLAVPSSASTIELLVDAADPAERRYHPARARVGRRAPAPEHRFVLVPLQWTIASGRFAGKTVPISPRLAFTPACPDCPAFYVTMHDAERPSWIRSWPDTVFPLRVAFDRSAAAYIPLQPSDSAGFWTVVARLQSDLGERLFEPASYFDTLPDENDGPVGVTLVRVEPRSSSAGRTIVVASRGAIEYAAVHFQSATLIRGADAPRLVAHEAMHVLGIGHTCAWRSLMAERRCAQQQSPTLTVEDAAYTLLLLRMRALQSRHAAAHGIEAALRGSAP